MFSHRGKVDRNFLSLSKQRFLPVIVGEVPRSVGQHDIKRSLNQLPMRKVTLSNKEH